MSNPIAVNLAFIPAEQDYLRIRALAQKLSSPFWLWQENAIPHLTVWMAVVESHSIQVIQDNFKFESLKLESRGCVLKKSARSEMNVVSLEFETSDYLQQLHNNMANIFSELEYKGEFNQAMFFNQYVSNATLNYVQNFRHAYAQNNYSPHITLGLAKLNKISEEHNLDGEIVFNKAGIFCIAEGCTCVSPIKIFQ